MDKRVYIAGSILLVTGMIGTEVLIYNHFSYYIWLPLVILGFIMIYYGEKITKAKAKEDEDKMKTDIDKIYDKVSFKIKKK